MSGSKNLYLLVITNLFILLQCQEEGSFETIFYPENEKMGAVNKLEGKIKIHGFLFDTQCTCTKNDPKEKIREKCDPSDIIVDLDKKGEYNLEKSKINNFVGDIKNLEWSDISNSYFSCIDGRVKSKGLSTPGGDAGEFILALHVYENYFKNEKILSKEQIKSAFQKYMKFTKSKIFYFCTDEKSVNRIKEEIKVN
jgi:hypothetical protein